MNVDNLWTYIGFGALGMFLGWFITDAVLEFRFKHQMRQIAFHLAEFKKEMADMEEKQRDRRI